MTDGHKRLIRSTAEFLIFTGQAGEQSIEARYEDETVWLTQKLMAVLFAADVRRARREIPVTMEDWAARADAFLEFTEHDILQDSGEVRPRSQRRTPKQVRVTPGPARRERLRPGDQADRGCAES